MGRESLNDVLVLRLEKGQDFFVPISANPIPSAFGARCALAVGLAPCCRVRSVYTFLTPHSCLYFCIVTVRVISIAQLAARVEPMRTATVIEDGLGLTHDVESAAAPTAPSSQSAAVLPKEIWRLVDFIYTRSVATAVVCLCMYMPVHVAPLTCGCLWYRSCRCCLISRVVGTPTPILCRGFLR